MISNLKLQLVIYYIPYKYKLFMFTKFKLIFLIYLKKIKNKKVLINLNT